MCLACAWGCTPPPTPGGTALTGRLAFTTPTPQETITAADDVDLQVPGIQVRVEVRGTLVPDGTVVHLDLDGVTQDALLLGSMAAFPVTLGGGPFPAGRAHTLTATAEGASAAVVTVSAVDNTGARCALLSPADGTVLHAAQDEDANVEGMQASVVVTCVGDGVMAGQPVRLEVFAGGGASGAPWGLASSTLQDDGTATFARVNLPDGTLTVQFGVDAGGPAWLGLGRSQLAVDLNRCDAHLVFPDGTVLLTSANTVDTDPSTPALDTHVLVTSTLCPDGAATLTVSGAASFSQPLVGGRGLIAARLQQGPNTLAVEVADARLVRSNGHDGPRTVSVDSLAPCPTLDLPAAGQVFSVADDEEIPPDPANGLTVTVHGTVDHAEGASRVELELTRLPAHVLVSLVNADVEGGAFSQTYVDLEAGDYVVSLSSQDDHGNRCPQRSAGRREVRFTVDLAGPRAALALADDRNADLVLTAAEDPDPAPGLQARVLVTVAGTPVDGASARVRFTPVDDQGNATADPPVETLANLLGLATVVTATVPDGRYRVSCVVSFVDTRPNITAATLGVLVDSTPPDLLILAPVDGSSVAEATVDVVVLCAAPDLARFDVLVDRVLQTVPAIPQGSGVYLMPGVPLPNLNGPHTLQVSATDGLGNRATATSVVLLQVNPPSVVVRGLDPGGMDRTLEGPSAGAPQPRTLLDISTPQGALALDWDGDASTGLQYGFSVEVGTADCASLGAHPQATLAVDGLAETLQVPLVTGGGACRGVWPAAGGALSLPDGDGRVVATVTNVMGNVGQATGFFTVRRQATFVRIDQPTQGQRLGLGPVTVHASTNSPAAGTCTLLLDMVPGQSLAVAGPSMTFDPVLLQGGDGSTVSLGVRCVDVSMAVLQSQPVTVVKDLSAPVVAITLLDGTAVPGAFNAASPSDAPPGHPRFLRDLAVEVDAERGGCSHLGSVGFTAQVGTDPARPYPPRTTAAGVWTFEPRAPVDRCQAVFRQVDLGAREEAGLTTLLAAHVTDSAGNTGQAPAATVLCDRVAPLLSRVAPVSNRVRPVEDALPGVPGVQVVVDIAVTSDTRPATAVMTCAGTDGASCPSSARPVDLGHVVFGADASDAVTLGGGVLVASAELTVHVTDGVGNVGTLVLPLHVADGAAVTWLAPADGTQFNLGGGNGRVADVDSAAAGIQARLTLDVLDCAVGALPGDLQLTANGVPLASTPVAGDGPVILDVTLPQGDGVVLAAQCTPPVGAPAASSITVTADGVAPGTVTLTPVVTHLRRGEVSVAFLAPGDDDAMGRLQPGAYQLAVGTDRDPTELDFATGGLGGAPAIPLAPGGAETALLTGLLLKGNHHVALRVQDDQLNSRISVATPITLALREKDLPLAGLTVTAVSRTRGDVNGDGVEDVVLTSSAAGGGGRVLVLLGDAGLTGTVSQGALLATAPRFPEVVPDLDGDGRAEILAWVEGTGGLLWFGRASLGADLGEPDLVLTAGAEAVDLGQRVEVADVDGDLHPDLLVSAPGGTGLVTPKVFVALGDGQRTGWSTSAGQLDLQARWQGPRGLRLEGAPGSQLGVAMAVVGDVDGNGASDVALGAPGSGLQAAGTVWLVMGRAGLGMGSIALETALPANLQVVALPGAADQARLGGSLVAADVDGNGKVDLVTSSAGGTWVFAHNGMGGFSSTPVAWGAAVTWLAPLGDANADLQADVLAGGEAWLGGTVAAAPQVYATVGSEPVASDVNGDGFPDFLTVVAGTLRVSY